MAANVHFSLICEPHLLDVVDEEWMRDTLPDDNISIPKEVALVGDDAEENEDLQQLQAEDKWTDLGLTSTN